MKMEFIFDTEKLKKENLTEEKCLNVIRNYFNHFKSKTLKETKKGIFEGCTEKDWSILASSVNLLDTNWFLKVIKEWYWYDDEGDGRGIQKEDFLESYYKYNEEI